MSDQSNISRRQALKAAGAAGISLSLAGCSGLGGSDPLQAQLDGLRELTEDYDGDIDAARDDGYVQLAGPGVPGMGWHLANPEYIQNAVQNGFSLEEPTVLCYDSEENLGAIEFEAPATEVSQSPDIFDDADSDARERWTQHVTGTHVIAVPQYDEQNAPEDITFDQLYNQQNWFEYTEVRSDIEPGDRVTETFPGHDAPETRTVDLVETHPTLMSLHVWMYEENPDGMFAEVNPNFGQALDSTNHTHE